MEEATLQEAFRTALRATATPVALLLVRDARSGGELRGATVTSWLSAALSPPTLVVSVGKARFVHGALDVGVRCSLILLAEGQEPAADHFSSRPGRERGVAPMRIRTTTGGWPTIDGSLATIETTVEALHSVDDHDLVVLRASGVEPGDGDAPLLWRAGGFSYLER